MISEYFEFCLHDCYPHPIQCIMRNTSGINAGTTDSLDKGCFFHLREDSLRH